MKDLVTIIVPVYNLENYIDKCVNSILNQTYGNIELILVNDGSKDRTLDKCNYFKTIDGRVVVISQENKGVSAARNEGIKYASGNYIMFVDGDDFVSEYIVEDLMRAFVDKDIIMAIGRGKIVQEYHYDFPKKEESALEILTNEEMIKRQLLGVSYAQGACIRIFKTDKLGDLRFDEQAKYNEDTFFTYKYNLKNNGKVYFLPKRLYAYYMRKDSASHKLFNEEKLAMVEFSSKIYNDCKDNAELVKYGQYNFINARMAIIKDIIRSKLYRKQRELVKILRDEIRKMGLPKLTELSSKKKIEFMCLKFSGRFYFLFVKIVDCFRRKI